jgi:hypothetical protein
MPQPTPPPSPEPAPQAEPRSAWSRLWKALSSGKVTHKLYTVLGILLLAVITAMYIQCIDTENMGFTHDDGVYATVGKSLALGKGFKLLHVIGEPGQIKYPFVYPLILSVVWFFMPHYPENLPALLYVTIAFTIASCWLMFIWLKDCQKMPGWLVLALAVIIPTNFYFIYFFSMVMSEAPYLFLTLLILWYFHRVTQTAQPLQKKELFWLVALSSLCFLTRVLGVAMMAGIGVWLLLNRQWKNALIYGLGCLFTGILPWVFWVKFNTPPISDFNYPLVNAYSNYGLEFFHNLTTANYLNGLGVSVLTMILKLQEVMVPLIPNFFKIYPNLKSNQDLVHWFSLTAMVMAYAVFGYFLLQAVSTLRKSWHNGKFSPKAFTLPGLYLFFYIVIITFWNYDDQMARFLSPVLPLVWLYFFKPLMRYLPDLGSALPSPRKKVVLASVFTLLACTIALWNVGGSYRTVVTSRTQHWVESGKYRWLWDEYKASFKWIRENLPQDARLSVASDVVFYLNTERPTFYTFYASMRRKNGKFTEDSIPLLMKSLDHYKVNYLVAEPHMQFRTLLAPVNYVAQQLMTQYPKRFVHLYGTPKGAIHVFKILPPEENPAPAKGH